MGSKVKKEIEKNAVKIGKDAMTDPWSLDRTMKIVVKDRTYIDVENWRSIPTNFLPPDFWANFTRRRYSSEAVFEVMVEQEDTIAAVKAYIQEVHGVSFKRQKLMNSRGGVLNDWQTLLSLKIKDGDFIVLRYAPVTRIFVQMLHDVPRLKLMVEHDDTVADVKIAVQEQEHIRFHEQRLIYGGRQLDCNDARLVDQKVEFDSVLTVVLKLRGC